jgi:quinol monooxygenase YgiN
MYGSIAKFRAKAGKGEDLIRLFNDFDRPSGSRAVALYRMDANPDEFYVVGAFESREAYHGNASTPEQDARFRQIRELLDADPEWHDGEIVVARRYDEVGSKA